MRATARYTTTRTFRDDPDDVADWFESSVRTYFAEWLASIQEPFHATLIALPAPEVRSAGFDSPYSSEGLEELVAGVREMQFSSFLLDITDYGSGASAMETRPGVAKISVDLNELDAVTPHWNEVEVLAAPDMLNRPPGLHALTGSLIAAAAEIGDGNGALRIGTTFERMLGQAGIDVSVRQDARAALDEPERWLQGVYWGNVLGPYHLDVLGGPGRVADALPRAEVVEFGKLDDEPSLYIQASAELADCTLDDMLAVHEVLRPLLPRPFNERSYAEPIMTSALETIRSAFP